MSMRALELPPRKSQRAFNLRRWTELCTDEELAKIQGRIETDRHGHIVLIPFAPACHGYLQAEIGHLLRLLMQKGRFWIACPISTADGVKIADVAWASIKRGQ